MPDRFADVGSGIVLDRHTGLHWSPVLGFSEADGPTLGGPMMSWGAATRRFGKGRQLKGSIFFSSRDESATHLGTASYDGYRFGSEVVEMGGFDDWRLPTAEEFWTLATETGELRNQVATFELPTELFGPSRDHLWTANDYGWLNGLQAAWQVMPSPYGYPDVVGDIGPGGHASVRLVRGGDVFARVRLPASAHASRRPGRVRFRCSPFFLTSPIRSLTTTYMVTEEEAVAARHFLGIPRGGPRVRIKEVTRVHHTGLLVGDVTFGEGSAEPVVWEGVFRPGRVRERVEALMHRLEAARTRGPLLP